MGLSSAQFSPIHLSLSFTSHVLCARHCTRCFGLKAHSAAVLALTNLPSPSWFSQVSIVRETPQEGPGTYFHPRTGGLLEKALKPGSFEGVDGRALQAEDAA